MRKIAMFKRNDDIILVIWQLKNNDLIGEAYNKEYKRGTWIKRVRFYGEMTVESVKQHFGYTQDNSTEM